MSVIRVPPTPRGAGHLFRAVVAAWLLVFALVVPAGAVEGPTKLFDPAASATSATPTTTITFTVTYRNREGSAPAYVRVVIDGAAHEMTGDGGDDWKGGVGHHFATKLPVGTHDVSFVAADTRKFTDAVDGGTVTISVPPRPRRRRPIPRPRRSPIPRPPRRRPRRRPPPAATRADPAAPARGGSVARRPGRHGGSGGSDPGVVGHIGGGDPGTGAPAAPAAAAAAAAAPARPDPRRAARPPAGPAIRRSRRRPGAAAPAIPSEYGDTTTGSTSGSTRRHDRRRIGCGGGNRRRCRHHGRHGWPQRPEWRPERLVDLRARRHDRRRWGVGRRQRLGPARLGARRARPPERSDDAAAPADARQHDRRGRDGDGLRDLRQEAPRRGAARTRRGPRGERRPGLGDRGLVPPRAASRRPSTWSR